MIALIFACKQEDPPKPPPDPPPDDTATTPTTIDTGTLPSGDLVLTPPNNYSLTLSYTLSEIEVRAGADLLVAWSAVTTDAWGDPLPPLEVERLVLLQVLAPHDEIEARLAADDLGADLLSDWTLDVSGRPFANLSELANGATTFVPASYLLENPAHSWVVALASARGDRLDLRAAALLVPEETSGDTTVTFADDTSTFAASAAIDGEPLVTNAASAPFSLDWEAMTTVLGGVIDGRADQLFLARMSADPTTLADQIADLPAVAEHVWFLETPNETAGLLELARDAEAATFPGFTSGDPWVVGLRCTTCLSRFPLFVASVEVR